MQNVEIASHAQRPIPPDQVVRLFRHEGWWPERTSLDVEAALHGSTAVAAWNDDVIVGFARAITDGCIRAYVEDVIVHPAVRQQGIGGALIRRLQALLPDTISPVTLFCGRELVPFYEGLGYASTHQVVLHRQTAPRGRA